MSRDEVFKLAPRPWRVWHGCVLDARDCEVLAVTGFDRDSDATEFAQMLVEWSQEKP